MYRQSYEEYIRSILGYPTEVEPMYDMPEVYRTETMTAPANRELESCYPEIYKVVYPMVNKACRSITGPANPEMVDRMTNEIYMAIEGNEGTQININLNNEVRQNREVASKDEKRNVKFSEREDRESRQFGLGLRDLIRILILRELLRPGHRPGHGPFPPPRPPFPGGPGRPPMRPRIYEDYFDDMYE